MTTHIFTLRPDARALIGIGIANASIILFGWLMEMTNNGLIHDRDGHPVRGRHAWWTPFWFGCVDGPGPTGFAYGIIVSLFVFFNSFAINQWLQYQQVRRWRDYLRGERTYIVLSLVAKSLLAWQVFANVLVG